MLVLGCRSAQSLEIADVGRGSARLVPHKGPEALEFCRLHVEQTPRPEWGRRDHCAGLLPR